MSAYLSDEGLFFLSQAVEHAIGPFGACRALREVRSVRSKAIYVLLGGGTVFDAIAIFAIAFAERLLAAIVPRIIVPALVTIAREAWLVDISGETASAEETPRQADESIYIYLPAPHIDRYRYLVII